MLADKGPFQLFTGVWALKMGWDYSFTLSASIGETGYVNIFLLSLTPTDEIPWTSKTHIHATLMHLRRSSGLHGRQCSVSAQNCAFRRHEQIQNSSLFSPQTTIPSDGRLTESWIGVTDFSEVKWNSSRIPSWTNGFVWAPNFNLRYFWMLTLFSGV